MCVGVHDDYYTRVAFLYLLFARLCEHLGREGPYPLIRNQQTVEKLSRGNFETLEPASAPCTYPHAHSLPLPSINSHTCLVHVYILHYLNQPPPSTTCTHTHTHPTKQFPFLSHPLVIQPLHFSQKSHEVTNPRRITTQAITSASPYMCTASWAASRKSNEY